MPQSRSVWDLSSSSSMGGHVVLDPAEDASGRMVRFSAARSGRQAPLKPLPSPNTRKGMLATRGNRVAHEDEDSTEEEKRRKLRKEKKKLKEQKVKKDVKRSHLGNNVHVFSAATAGFQS